MRCYLWQSHNTVTVSDFSGPDTVKLKVTVMSIETKQGLVLVLPASSLSSLILPSAWKLAPPPHSYKPLKSKLAL